MSLRLNIIVAACENQGIGINGELPWRLREEMKYFSRMTKATTSSGKQNAVLMGRKTWESIPAKFRPLPGRVNVVISSRAKDPGAEFNGSTVCGSFKEGIQELQNRTDEVESVWAIGGSSIYEIALESEHLHRIYLTRILKNFECDTFLPSFDPKKFQIVTDPAVPDEMQQEGDIIYKYEVYEKVK
ncbi:dihydrofolate reductase-like [Penaeus japonicus]|uniref:dihydrofolate reductase-like n=1 Tax=Penaeus japonicus TaxID=27405 RepID=UPI001C710BDF|nr:dihydrofolate reductase-like [Penaeus japonicus]XP_042879175.1 dihydrofolate reductase-like [Penaeus japonicus]